jgi:phage terminase large subunit
MAKQVRALFEATDLYTANLNATAHKVINQGGTYSGKTYAIMQALFTEALNNPRETITVAAESIPTIKAGALKDAQDIVHSSPLLASLIIDYHATDRVYTLANKSKIEFKSYKDWGSAKNGKRHRLFINEVNNVPKRICDELMMRTEKKIYLDYNPNEEFWVHTELIGQQDVKFIRSWHEHNTFLTPVQHKRIEDIADAELWKVYARGITGKLEGLILRNWHECDYVPLTARLIGTGMDFGYTNDPTAVVNVYMGDGALYLDELIYSTDLTNDMISAQLKAAGHDAGNVIIADSADPKSIDELTKMRWYMEAANKGPDSIKAGIDILNRYKIYVTRRSINLKKELRTYKWRQTKTGLLLNEPVDFNNHALDAVRYVALNRLGANFRSGKIHIETI